jgi:hypothetical protein
MTCGKMSVKGEIMGARQQIQRQIDKKYEEIGELTERLTQAHAYVNGLEDALKLLPKEDEAGREVILRHGTAIAQARDALRTRGVAMHISEILAAVKRPDTHENRIALSGSIAAYVRKGQIFTRTGPNVFGLIEFGPQRVEESEDKTKAAS